MKLCGKIIQHEKMWKKSFFYKSKCQFKSNPVKSETESLGKEIFFQFQI